MGMTLAQKIIASHSDGLARIGEIKMVRVDYAMGHDISGPHAEKVMKQELGVDRVWDPTRVVLIPDHFVPAKDVKAADLSSALRRFAKEQGIKNYFEIGRAGICHVVLPEEGFALPGTVIIGGDSHSCTYGAFGCFATGVGATDLGVVFATGEIWLRVPSSIKVVLTGKLNPWVYPKDIVLWMMKNLADGRANYKVLEYHDLMDEKLTMDGRMTISNMAIEGHAKAGMFLADEVTDAYLAGRARALYQVVTPDPDAEYDEEIHLNVSTLEPQVARPYSPDRVSPLSEIEREHIRVDQVIIGSCTNARLSDLKEAARVLQGHSVHPDVRLIVIPGSQRVYREALKAGIIDIFMDAGAAVSFSTCGPCFGGHAGVLGKGERALSTTNRNFHGRMGHPDAEVYLGSPAVAAATAILGYIASPERVVGRARPSVPV
ncbi:MAG: 3-isopropylmalate dehydratase large subunit [bacterium JZ-2024 1]